jgi:hypothetical protein
MALNISINEVTADVVITLNGSVNLAGLTLNGNETTASPGVFSGNTIRVAPASTNVDRYEFINGLSTGAFGNNTSNIYAGSFTSTDYISLLNLSTTTGVLQIPSSYISGNPLSNSMTFVGQSFLTMGLNTGSYVYSWGSGANADSVTVYVGVTPPSPTTINAPLPFSWSLIGVNATGVVSTSSVTGSFAGFTVVSGSATFTGLKDANGVNLASIASPLIVSAGVTYPIFVTSASLSSGAVLFYP